MNLHGLIEDNPGPDRDYLFKAMETNEIIQWLEGPQDYARGRELFERHSKKQGLINLFRRKHKPEVLRYNLEKIAGTKAVNRAVPAIQPPKLVILDGRIRLEDLPGELKPLYQENRELYPRMRALHEKMKLPQEEEQRAQLRRELARLDDRVSANWEKIDQWAGAQNGA